MTPFLWFLFNLCITISEASNCTYDISYTKYTGYRSVMKTYGGSLDVTWNGAVIGVTSTGNVTMIGGNYKYGSGTYGSTAVVSIDLYDSPLAYDDETLSYNNSMDNYWVAEWQVYPPYSKPSNGYFLCDQHSTKCTFYCWGPCSTQMYDEYHDDIIYIINPTMVTPSLSYSESWKVLIKFNMSSRSYVPPEDYTYEIPYDRSSFYSHGCTTNNGTHIWHFNLRNNTHTIIIAYNVAENEWLMDLTPNPQFKYYPACSSDTTRRYIYLFGGCSTSNYHWASPILQTERYDTWTDSWIMLGEAAHFPDPIGRCAARAMLDDVANQILIIGGESYSRELVRNQTLTVWNNVDKIEQFYLGNETFKSTNDATQYGTSAGPIRGATSIFKVNNFVPNGQQEQFEDFSVDLFFAFGGGGSFGDIIQFITALSDREIYSDNSVILEVEYPEESETTTFDAFQRFELQFRVITTEGFPYLVDDSFEFEFKINGLSIDEVNEQYLNDTNEKVLQRESQLFTQSDCEALSANVLTKVRAEIMIPSRRTLHNGYCADPELNWIFPRNGNAIITLIATNGTYTHSKDFVFHFATFTDGWIRPGVRYETMYGIDSPDRSYNKTCKIKEDSFQHGPLQRFGVHCYGFDYEGAEKFKDISHEFGYTQAYVEYNVLMNDVLVNPSNWIAQTNEFSDDAITVTEGLVNDELIAVIRVLTEAGTWYQECFYDFDLEKDQWQSIDDINKADDDFWADLLDAFNSNDTNDIIAAFSIIVEFILDETMDVDELGAHYARSIILQNMIMEKLSDIINSDLTDKNLDELMDDIALINLMTEFEDLVEVDIIKNITNQWIPALFDKTLEIIDDSDGDNANAADLVQTMGKVAADVAANLIVIVNNTAIDFEQLLLENLQRIALYAMSFNWEQETIIYLQNSTNTFGQRVKVNNDSFTVCNYSSFSINIPPSINSSYSDSSSLFCIITVTQDNSTNVIDLFDDNGFTVYTTNDECFPYMIKMTTIGTVFQGYQFYNYSHDDSDDDEVPLGNFPKCVFWSKEESKWDNEGCFVYDYTSTYIECACTHLTSFSISAEDFDPKPEILEADDFRIVTGSNMQRHPTTMVVMSALFIVLLISCICAPSNNKDRPIIAFEDIIYKEFRDEYLRTHQQWDEIVQIDRWYTKLMNRRTKKKTIKYWMLLSYNLFKTYVKNDHTILSVFQRSDGTNFSTKQRVGLFLLYLYFIMTASAIFYGNKSERKAMGDLIASALISLIGTVPVYLIRVLFQWSKPIVIKSYKQNEKKMTQDEMMISVGSTSDIMMSAEAIPASPSTTSMSGSDPLSTGNRPMLKLDLTAMDCWPTIEEIQMSSRPKMETVKTWVSEVGETEKVYLAEQLRLKMFNYNYPFPHYVKKIAWTLLILLCILCFIFSAIYGLQFDLYAEEMNIMQQNQDRLREMNSEIVENEDYSCWNLSRKLVIQSQVYQQEIERIQNEQFELQQQEEVVNKYSTDFGEGVLYDSSKWLLSVLISFLTSVFFWQPLSIYILTLFKMWSFNHGLSMEASLYNFMNMICCCCYKQKNKSVISNYFNYSNEHESQLVNSLEMQEIATENEESMTHSKSNNSNAGIDTLINNQRELDLIGYLSNDQLFVEGKYVE